MCPLPYLPWYHFVNLLSKVTTRMSACHSQHSERVHHKGPLGAHCPRLSVPPQPVAATPMLSVSSIWSLQESHVNGTVPHITVWDWFFHSAQPRGVHSVSHGLLRASVVASFPREQQGKLRTPRSFSVHLSRVSGMSSVGLLWIKLL